MSEHIQAIYENGVLRPLQPLDLPENSIVEIKIRAVLEKDSDVEDSIKNELADLEASENEHLEEELKDCERSHQSNRRPILPRMSLEEQIKAYEKSLPRSTKQRHER